MQLSGARLRVHNPGGDVLVDLVSPSNTTTSLATARITPAMVAVSGQWVQVEWPPVQVAGNQPLAIEVTATDTSTALGAAKIGEKDPDRNAWATAPGVEIGKLFSVNASGISTEQAGTMLTIEVLEPIYTAATQDVPLATAQLADATDLMIVAASQQPEATASVSFRLGLEDGRTFEVPAGQRIELDTPYTGAVTCVATLKRGGTMAPVLEPGTNLVYGVMAASADYIGTTFDMKAGTQRLRAILAAYIPSGSAVQVQMQAATAAPGDPWQTMPFTQSSPNTAGFIEMEYERTGITAAGARLRLVLTGQPKARPQVKDLRAVALQ